MKQSPAALSIKVFAIVSFIALAAITVMSFYGGPRSRLAGFGHPLQHEYDQLLIGTSKDEVFSKIGQPFITNTEFVLPGCHAFEKERGKTNGLNVRIYYGWINGCNWYYCLGFDSEDRLAVKAEGSD